MGRRSDHTPEQLQDLVLSAVNEAARQVDERLQGALGGMAPGLGIPGFGQFSAVDVSSRTYPVVELVLGHV